MSEISNSVYGSENKLWLLKGSTEKNYFVRYNGSTHEWNCMCKGYKFRNYCKHITSCKIKLLATILNIMIQKKTSKKTC